MGCRTLETGITAEPPGRRDRWGSQRDNPKRDPPLSATMLLRDMGGWETKRNPSQDKEDDNTRRKVIVQKVEEEDYRKTRRRVAVQTSCLQEVSHDSVM